jgi:hypothetical protein
MDPPPPVELQPISAPAVRHKTMSLIMVISLA